MDDDGDDKDDTKRRTRNLSEKKRRDQFNMLVNELGSMISTTNRRMDKSTILKSTISFLKNHNEVTVRSRVHDIQEDWKPTFLSNEEFTYLMLEALEGFVMVCSPNGHICYVSESITSLLGHNPNDIVNTSLFELTFEEDQQKLYNILQNNTAGNDHNQTLTPENEIRFLCHLQRGTLDFRDNITYELIQFSGHFRVNIDQNENDEMSGYKQDRESRVLFVCTGRLFTPHLIRDVSLVDSNHSEFTSRHSLEWKFLGLDYRAPPIIGYLPFEVLGTSGYDYYHFDDLEKVTTCHEALMQKGELTSCYYRFLTKGQQWIWLQTRFYITYHQWNAKPEFVVCTHRVVSNADVAESSKKDAGEAKAVPEMKPHEEMKRNNAEVSMYDRNESYGASYHSVSQSPSVKSTSGSTSSTVTPSGSGAWSRQASQVCYNTNSDTASISSGSRSSQRNSVREPLPSSKRDQGWEFKLNKLIEPIVIPQHYMGTQYLQPPPYFGTISVPGVLQAPVIPVIPNNRDQAQIQEQLQRKHEELQQMIVRQQEELRQVKEQLLLARLGILQPIVNVSNAYNNQEDIQNQQLDPAQIHYGEAPSRPLGYGQPQAPPDERNQPPPNPHIP